MKFTLLHGKNNTVLFENVNDKNSKNSNKNIQAKDRWTVITPDLIV